MEEVQKFDLSEFLLFLIVLISYVLIGMAEISIFLTHPFYDILAVLILDILAFPLFYFEVIEKSVNWYNTRKVRH